MSAESRPRRNGRLVLALAALALAGSTAFLTWWTTTLVGLPDVGDPFDVEAFDRPIPDETNAFVLYKQAAAILPKEPEEVANYDWKTASPEQRAWFDRSREALQVWRRATERPDALYNRPGSLTFDSKLDLAQTLRSFGRLALLEGSRLEDLGDYETALDWYLALLRSTRHSGRRGTMIERLIGIAMHRWVSTRLMRWASDPKVDAKLLRRALDAAKAADAATPPTSDALKVEFMSLVRSLADADLMGRMHDYQVVSNGKGGSTTLYGQHGWTASFMRVRRRSINDPERSIRVMRMIFANWLAFCDLPRSKQPPKVNPANYPSLTGPAKAVLGDLFVVAPDAPAQARALPPEKLAGWFGSTIDASMALPAFVAFDKALLRERSAQDSLLFTLANELYKREHGRYPEKVEELVGPYLKELPPGSTLPPTN